MLTPAPACTSVIEACILGEVYISAAMIRALIFRARSVRAKRRMFSSCAHSLRFFSDSRSCALIIDSRSVIMILLHEED